MPQGTDLAGGIMTGVTEESAGAGDDGDGRPWALRRRRREALLLGLAVVTGCYGYAYVGLSVTGTVPDGLPGFAAALVCLAVVPHLAMRRWAPYADPLILPLAVLLSAFGLVLLYRLDPAYRLEYHAEATAPAQLVWTVTGGGGLRERAGGPARPPQAAALPLRDDGRGAGAADGARLVPRRHLRRQTVDLLRAAVLPAGRVRQDHDRGLLRRLSGRSP
ncbi:hypothetical protein GCM10020000_68470 [Streptomyces olivoverticillatus]